MKLFANRRGQVTFYISFMIAAIFIILVAAFFAPMGVRFNTEMYLAGEKILNNTQESINDIADDTIREQINASIEVAKAAQVTNISVNASLFQYSWILVLAALAIIIFLQTRRMVEFGAGGFI